MSRVLARFHRTFPHRRARPSKAGAPAEAADSPGPRARIAAPSLMYLLYHAIDSKNFAGHSEEDHTMRKRRKIVLVLRRLGPVAPDRASGGNRTVPGLGSRRAPGRRATGGRPSAEHRRRFGRAAAGFAFVGSGPAVAEDEVCEIEAQPKRPPGAAERRKAFSNGFSALERLASAGLRRCKRSRQRRTVTDTAAAPRQSSPPTG